MSDSEKFSLQPKKRRQIEFPLTPMLDVMFILLTVFIAVSEQRQSSHRLEIPEVDDDAQEASAAELEKSKLLMQIKSDGAVLIDGAPVEAQSLEGALAAAREKLGPSMRVQLEAEEAADYGAVLRVLRKLRAADVKDVDLAYKAAKEGSR